MNTLHNVLIKVKLQDELQANVTLEEPKVLTKEDITEDIVLDNISKIIRIYSIAKEGKVSFLFMQHVMSLFFYSKVLLSMIKNYHLYPVSGTIDMEIFIQVKTKLIMAVCSLITS